MENWKSWDLWDLRNLLVLWKLVLLKWFIWLNNVTDLLKSSLLNPHPLLLMSSSDRWNPLRSDWPAKLSLCLYCSSLSFLSLHSLGMSLWVDLFKHVKFFIEPLYSAIEEEALAKHELVVLEIGDENSFSVDDSLDSMLLAHVIACFGQRSI